MLLIARKLLLSLLLSMMLLPMVAMASTEFKGKETVNINKANAATLAAYLKGVGVNKAEAIVKYRKSNGSFKSAADIKNVPGIGDETYKDIKSKISTSRGKSTAPKGYKLGESSGKSKSTKKKSTSKAKKSSTKKSASTKSKTSSKKSTSSKSKTSKAKKTATTKKATTKKSTSKKKPSSTKKKVSKKKTKKKPAKKKTTKKKKKSS